MMKRILKKNLQNLKIVAASLLFVTSIDAAIAAQCAAVFPDGASTHSAGGSINFEHDARLIGSDDNLLATNMVTESNSSNIDTCNVANCTATGTPSNASTTVTFQTTNSTTDVDMEFDTAVVIGSGTFSGNEFREINSSDASKASITFSATQSEYFVDSLVLASENTLYLQAGGTYWINQLSFSSQAEIIVQGSGTAFVYVNQSVNFASPVLINSPSINNSGDASKFVMHVFADVTFSNNSTYTGSLYAQGNLTLGSSSYAFGAISAANITLGSQSTITYQSGEITDTDFGNMCTASSSSSVQADSCSIYFPDTIQGHTESSQMKFKNSGQVIGDVDATLTFPWLSGSGGSTDTCDTTDCVVTGTYAPALTLPTFDTKSSTFDIYESTGTTIIGTTEIRNLTVGGNAIVTFSDSATKYTIDDALFNGGTITFNPGTYWFNELEIKGDSVVIINGAVTLYVNGQSHHLDIENSAEVNLNGAAKNLAIISYEQIHLKGTSKVNAVLYSAGNDIKLENQAKHRGSISSAGKMEIKGSATSTYEDISGVQIGDLCGAPPQELTPLLDYRFDEFYWSGSSNEVIDSSGNNYNGTAVGGISTTPGKICNAADIPSNNSASIFEAVDTGVDLDTIIGSSGTISLWYKADNAWNSGADKRLFDATDGDKYFVAEITSDGRVKFFFEDGNDGDYQNTTVNAFSVGPGVWKHLAFVWDIANTTAKIFVDGVEQNVSGSNNDGGTTPFTGYATLYFGDNRSASYFSGESSADGLIDEALVFDSVVSSAQIQTIFTNQDAGNNYDGSTRDCPVELLGGRVTLNNTAQTPAFTAVCFDTPFSEIPHVFSLPATAGDSDRLALRIRKVTRYGFDIAQVESPEDANPEAPNGNVSQTVDFLAVVKGDYELNGGATMRVKSKDTQSFVGAKVSDSKWETISTADLGFSQTPAIIASIQTMRNETTPFPISDPFFATAIEGVTDNEFRIALERAETDSGTIGTYETISYIAITPGFTGQLGNNISYESFRTEENIKGIECRIFDLNGTYSENPLVIASQNTRAGSNGGWLRRCAISTSDVGFSIVEDMDSDVEGKHVIERAGGISLGGTFTNQTCDVQPSLLHHYEITHDGQGLTCDAETVTIKACANADCSTLITQPVTLDFLAEGAVISSPTFTGSTTVTFNNTDVETVTLSLTNTSITASNALVCEEPNGNSCDIEFTDAGFRFLSGAGNSTTLPNQTSGAVFGDSLNIQAVQDTDGVCTGLFSGNKNVDLSQQNVQPGGTSGLNFLIDGNTIAKHSSTTNTTLNFGADSIAIIPTPVYHDAGQIRLHANYNVGGVTLTGTSNSFWVSPAKLVVSAKSDETNLNGATATATTTYAAGGNFDLTVTAYNAATPAVVTPNYSPGQIQLMLTRTGPTSTDSVDGNLSYATSSVLTSTTSPSFVDVTLSNFSSGVSTYNAAQYSEVGLINLDVRDNNYGNINMPISAAAINIGRFIPAYFEQTVVEDGRFSATCNTSTTFLAYSGQMDEATNSIGAISYFSNPILAITAYNSQGNITQNYFEDSQGSINDYMKLSASDIKLTLPTIDQSAVDVNSNPLTVSATMGNGNLSQTDLRASSGEVELPRGTLHYRLSNVDRFYYQRSANALVAPFTSDIDFAIATITDTDNVSVSTSVTGTKAASPIGVEIRFARLTLKNSFGPETSNFPQLMEIEHFDGANFVDSLDENCASYDAGLISLTDISLNPALTSVLGGTEIFVNGKTQAIELQAPGSGNQGQIGVLYDAYDWFNYDWNGDGFYNNNPEAVATFGIYRGNDRTIHWREVFND